MARPLYWLKANPRLSDEALVANLSAVLLQLRNRTHQEDEQAREWLEGLALAFLDLVEQRIAQGTLF